MANETGPPDTLYLLNTTDARVWAQEFVKILEANHQENAWMQGCGPEFDEAFMIGWFANAIETGRAAGLGHHG